jgi:Tfp pilus assembly protein PilN
MKNGIDLVPDEIKRERLMKKARAILIVAGFLYLAALVALFTFQRMEIKDKSAALSALQAKRDSLLTSGARQAELAGRLAEIRKAQAVLTQRVNATAGLSGKKVAWAFILKNLAADVPEGLWLRGISTFEADSALKRVRLKGSATSNRVVADFISSIENSGLFTGVSLTYTQKKEDPSGLVYDFELYMDLKRTEATVHDW